LSNCLLAALSPDLLLPCALWSSVREMSNGAEMQEHCGVGSWDHMDLPARAQLQHTGAGEGATREGTSEYTLT